MTLDSLLLILFIAVFLIHCYRKKKFPFSKLKKGEDQTETAQNTAGSNIVPMPVMYGMPTGIPPHAVYCRVIGVNTDVTDSDADLEHIVCTELSKLTATGFAVQNVNAFAFTTDGTDTHISFIIIYSR